MKVFISWSGELSRSIGEILHTWLPATIQLVKPYFTPADIEKGARWNSEILAELEASNVGLFIFTPGNLDSQWMIFEAGALAKRVASAYVCPILIDLKPSDLPKPLQQYQAVSFTKGEFWGVMQMINNGLEKTALAEKTLEQVFAMWWPKLEGDVRSALQLNVEKAKVPPPTDRQILEELLAQSRSRMADSARARPESDGTLVNSFAILDLTKAFANLCLAHDLDVVDSATLDRLRRPIEHMVRRMKESPRRAEARDELAKLPTLFASAQPTAST